MIACGYALMDYARFEAPTRRGSFLTSSAIVIAFLSTIFVAAIDGPVLFAVLPFAAMSLVFILWRWRRLVAGPAALPAGRLAKGTGEMAKL